MRYLDQPNHNEHHPIGTLVDGKCCVLPTGADCNDCVYLRTVMACCQVDRLVTSKLSLCVLDALTTFASFMEGGASRYMLNHVLYSTA